jgi:signal transduction histidine kinase/CHASE3 domain sensor protein/DNA-binding response OmpR family regulator
LVASASVAVVSWSQLHDSRQLVLHTYDVISTARLLLSSIEDAETGQRGYVITQRAEYLESYQQALPQIPKLVAQLHALTHDNPAQQRRLEGIERAIGTKLAELASTIATLHSSGYEAARAEVMTDVGHNAMTQIRRLIGDAIADEQSLLTSRISATDDIERRARLAAIGAMIAALLALAFTQMQLVGRNARLARAEATAALQAGLLQATLDHTREGIVAFDPAGRLQAFNRRFFEHLDLPPGLAAEGTALDALLAADAARPPAILNAVVSGKHAKTEEDVVFQGRIGSRSVEIGAQPDGTGGLLLSTVDVTRRVQAEAMAAQSQRMEAIGHLTGGIAHDFNNLLQIVRSNLDLAMPLLSDHAAAKQRIENALAGAGRGAQLTRQLLAFARRQPLEPRVINLSRVISDMGDLLRRTLGDRIEVETVAGGGLWNTRTDPTQIENALLNLAINARDAMPEGGKLTIELANAALDDDYSARHAEVSPGQYVLLAVTDTGHGMPPEVMARAFEPFFSTKGEGRGSGLGLAQVYGFVHQSGGHIKIYSEVGRGTTVKIYLPRSLLAQEEVRREATRSVVGGSETILVVEDNADVRRGAVDLIAGLGYRVIEAATVEGALDALAAGERIDLLFTDVVMPGPLRTTALAARARELQPHIGVLFTSGYTENAIIHNRELDPKLHFIGKPYGREELARRLRSALPERSAVAGPRSADERQPSTGRAVAGSGPGPTISISEPERLAPSDATPARAPGSPLRILVVEDDPLVRMTTLDMLAELGHDAVTASSGSEALRLLKAGPRCDLLLTDLGLPDIDGKELARRCRALQPDLRVVLATGYSTAPEDAGDPVARLGKPFTIDDLAGVIGTTMAA